MKFRARYPIGYGLGRLIAGIASWLLAVVVVGGILIAGRPL